MANIARRRRSGFVLRDGRQRRETLWGFITPSATTIAAASSATLLTSLSVAALALRPFTIVRTRVRIAVRSDQAAAVERQSGAYGECVVSDQAVAIGVTAVPTPITDLGSDLLYLIEPFFSDESSLTDRTRGQWSGAVDSRAMRKVEEGSDVVIVTENSGLSLGTEIFTSARFLIKLH